MPQSEDQKISELRQDITSGEWVVIATNRGKRPIEFAAFGDISPKEELGSCPFEIVQADATLIITEDGKYHDGLPDAMGHSQWFIQVFPNKYPAFLSQSQCGVFKTEGLYRMTQGIGHHEVIATRSHDRPIALLEPTEVALLIHAYQRRMEVLVGDPCVEYICVLENHGPLSGASVKHPHSQLLAIPVIPPVILRSLQGSERYFEAHHTCVHCKIIEFEMKEKTRVIYENDDFIVITPFASHAAFEIRIFPKSHSAEFQTISEREINSFAEAMHKALAKLFQALKDPSYNFYIHTAPVKGKDYAQYHWHLEILPKTSTWGGFEFGTGIEISTIAPEEAAEFLRDTAA